MASHSVSQRPRTRLKNDRAQHRNRHNEKWAFRVNPHGFMTRSEQKSTIICVPAQNFTEQATMRKNTDAVLKHVYLHEARQVVSVEGKKVSIHKRTAAFCSPHRRVLTCRVETTNQLVYAVCTRMHKTSRKHKPHRLWEQYPYVANKPKQRDEAFLPPSRRGAAPPRSTRGPRSCRPCPRSHRGCRSACSATPT